MPRSFAIQVKTGLSLNQLRLARGDVRLDDDEIRDLQDEFPLLYLDSHALRQSELAVSDGLFLSVDLSGPGDRTVGYRAKKNSLPVDLSRIRAYRWTDYWDPVFPEPGGRIVLEPEIFYLLLSAEGVCIPPADRRRDDGLRPDRRRAAHPLRGLLRPRLRLRPGRRAPRQPRGARGPRPRRPLHGRAPPAGLQAGLERMAAPAERLYGASLGSNYQGQVTMLSKHFEEQTRGSRPRLTAATRLAGPSVASSSPRTRLRFASSSASSLAISSRRRRTSSSWRAMWPSDSSRISRRRTGSSTPAVPLAAQRGAGALGLDQLLQLLQRDAEQVLQAQQLGQALDVGLGVGAVGAGLAAAGDRQQADLLVVADRPRRRAGQLGDVADPQLGAGRGSAHGVASISSTIASSIASAAAPAGAAPALGSPLRRSAAAARRRRRAPRSRPAPTAPCACCG